MMLKDEIKKLIDHLPNDCSIEDIQYTLYVRSKIEKGIEDLENGNIVSQEEMKKRFDKWLSQ
ncbi:hypothetical protein CWR48_03510 [Oceanobacillus arenosus]|uniref:Uncharacterized protein n=2 Tax=Oceanobacillus arenosus TaxID=1229153 RepID=A0A3D8PZB3_9BACI|nr:hypothetical protein CWR48_03510 [Oceanobacillus arenosus]